MAYDTIERSNADGRPVALYEFIYGSIAWRYCASTQPVTVGGNVYEPIAISDGGYTMSGEPTDDTMAVTCDSTIDVANMLNGAPPSETIWVMVRRYHRGDNEAPIVWIGYVATRKQVSSVEVEIRCKMLTAGFDRDGARLTYNRMCPHPLYGVDCRVNKVAFARTFQVSSVTGNSVTASFLGTLPAGYLSNGFFEWSRFAGALERRGIEVHSGNTFTVLGSTAGLEAGDYITAYPGCGRTRADCKNKFNNLPNFGGFAHLPGKSPFEGDPVF